MRLDDSYRLLEVDANASDDAVRNAYRDLLKVWHPDRFAHDPQLRLKSEEKLKAINDAYDTIREARAGEWSDSGSARREPPPYRPQPDARSAVARRYSTWMFACVFGAIFLLLRRPTPTGLVIALVLVIAAGVLFSRMRAALRE